jgi:hypothetical protein
MFAKLDVLHRCTVSAVSHAMPSMDSDPSSDRSVCIALATQHTPTSAKALPVMGTFAVP